MSRARYLPGPIRRAKFGRDFDTLERLKAEGRIVMGQGTYGVPVVETYAHDDTRLIFGAYTSIAKRATFILGGNHPADRVTTFPLRIMRSLPGAGSDGYPYSKGDIRVGSDVWIGYGALVLSGVTIGDGAMVAARSVVSRDVPPFSIVAGTPARVLRYRHTPEQSAALLEISWWDWPEEQIDAAVERLTSPDIDSFIEWAHTRRQVR
jgi:acetyltransferase-like isoleucine patch superfamily enzyme